MKGGWIVGSGYNQRLPNIENMEKGTQLDGERIEAKNHFYVTVLGGIYLGTCENKCLILN